MQYYIYHADTTGLALLSELVAAADRGVRVRLLLDDIHTGGFEDAIAAIDAHGNIEVRLFNPFAHRDARWLDLLSDFSRVNRRMHNKSMTADSQASVIGGRNVGDEYFGAGSGTSFSDLDVIVAGPVAREISAVFDEYWNSAVVYPVRSLGGHADAQAGLALVRLRLADEVMRSQSTPYVLSLAQTGLVKAIAEKRLRGFVGDARVIADRPEKVTLPPEDSSTHAAPQLGAVLSRARNELILVSPYFVPGEDGVRWLADIVARGVRVQILTNSFAATDVRAVHAGYSRYRVELLRAGVELYEMRPDTPASGGVQKHLTGSGSHGSLHAKTYMVDAAALFVGSLNLDPRSGRLNTEMGVVLESPELCSSLRETFEAALLDSAYRVEISGDGLAWITRDGGREVRFDAEPGMGFGARAMQGLMQLLPIEKQL